MAIQRVYRPKMSTFDVILDKSQQKLTQVPSTILEMSRLKMLYLEGNLLKKLPPDFFPSLPLLSWLDLRNNQLTDIPTTIANHAYLENFLISGNKLEKLPNELGLVPQLRVFQVADNPLVYPDRKIIMKGVKAITSFLKEEYLSSRMPNLKQIEKEINQFVADNPLEQIKRNLANINLQMESTTSQNKRSKISHELSKNKSKVSVKSSCVMPKNSREKFHKAFLKEEFMARIKAMLMDQEKLLQQERNLRVLHSWRQDKKSQPTAVKNIALEPPYATYPEYNTMLSRQDLSIEIDKLIEKSRQTPRSNTPNIDSIISDLMCKIKSLETIPTGGSPRTEARESASQIETIMGIHKVLQGLQSNSLIKGLK